LHVRRLLPDFLTDVRIPKKPATAGKSRAMRSSADKTFFCSSRLASAASAVTSPAFFKLKRAGEICDAPSLYLPRLIADC